MINKCIYSETKGPVTGSSDDKILTILTKYVYSNASVIKRLFPSCCVKFL